MGRFSLLALAGAAAASPLFDNTANRQLSCQQLLRGNSTWSPEAYLPDPFTSYTGKPITTSAEWACRQAELSQLFQKYELGTKPGPPDQQSSVLSGTTLNITSTVANQTGTFSVTVQVPAGEGPFPAIIVYGGASIPIPSNVATIIFQNDVLAQENSASSRGIGLFYDLYGSSATAAATTAWAWGVSRVLDALESPSTASLNIDAKRVGVTGCSRNGKGAFIAGALDDRIALTIPQESGSGGSGCWRLSDYMLANNISTQTAGEIVQENVWFATAFDDFTNDTARLPFDHHELAGLVAPRGLFVTENDITWLGPFSGYGCMTAGRRIYEALGDATALGYSEVGNHSHCAFPAAQEPELTAFINRFLLDTDDSTDIFHDDLGLDFDEARWTPWGTPDLS